MIAAAFDFEWIVLAMAFIAFVRWIIERVTGKGKDKLEDDDSTIVDDDDVQRRREEALLRQTGGDSSGAGLDPNSEIRKFFEALGGQVTKAPPPAERALTEGRAHRTGPPPSTARVASSSPPPLPAKAKPQEARKGGDQSVEFQLHEKQAYALGEQAARRKRKGRRGSLGKMLSSPEGLRAAVLMHEILGPPRSLQSIEDSHKF
jgi:hypothetical protein